MAEKLWPKVGVGVWIVNDEGKALMLKRQGSHAPGTWHFAGGKLETGESFLDCVRREVREETGLDVSAIKIVGVTNDIFSFDNHYVTVFTQATKWSGRPSIKEPEKCSEIGWFDIHNLPEPLFLTIKNLQKSDFPCVCGRGKRFRECGA